MFTGNKKLDDETLDGILDQLNKDLQNKNVAHDVAVQICNNMRISLLNKYTDSYTTAYNFVRKSLYEIIRNILSFEKNIDIINDGIDIRQRNEKNMNNFNPLVIVFCGVNGVGKSTNMAKIAYRFKMKAKLSVMIAACDTFRAGAIEQVKKHAKVLDIKVFDKG